MNVGILVSGNGTNLQALLDAEARGELAPASIVSVVSNKPGVRALERARAAGKPAIVIDHTEYANRAAFEKALIVQLSAQGVELVVLAGFMRVLTPLFIERYAGRIINTHPSLLPAFPGAHPAADAIAYGVKVSGVSIHFVDASLDGGPIIEQVVVPVQPDDDADALQARIQAEEHRLLPQVVRRLAAGLITCEGRHVVVRAE
jgi:phosphoribosylglycinamide formyltransferase-1